MIIFFVSRSPTDWLKESVERAPIKFERSKKMKYRTLFREPSWGLFRDYDRFNESMNRLFDSRFSTSSGETGSDVPSLFEPRCDIEEAEGHFVMHFDLPGMSKDEVEINVEGQQLSISGERKREFRDVEGSPQRIERSYGHFKRSFSLPEGVVTDEIEANFDHGVLSLIIPKAAASKPQKIQISEGKKDSLLGRVFGKKEKLKAAQ